ncbi:MAG: hypothetical protein MJZ61_06685 [Bacteroidales bacterium]|nr:hypothetical protein [Bacteroidales bacterium]
MKKFAFCLMALALCATIFTSCHKDDDDDNKDGLLYFKCNTVDGDFNTKVAAFYSSEKEAGTSKLSNIFGADDVKKSTTILASQGDKQVYISLKGTEARTYKLGLDIDKPSQGDLNQMLIDLLTGKSAVDIAKEVADDAVDGVKAEVMVIYRSANSDENSSDYYFSTKAEVTFNVLLAYSTGNFTATMRNKDGKTFEMAGEFSLIGKPALPATAQ